MKRLLLGIPIVVLIAAGCNSSSKVSTDQTVAPTPVAQSATPTPTTVLATPTPTPTTTSLKNYGTNFSGFIAASKTCTPSEVTVTINQNTGLGVINTDTENAQILGYSGQYCHIFSTRT